jgi:integration host factor subunit beta
MGANHQRVRTYTKRDVAKRVAEVAHLKMHTASESVDNVFAAIREIMLSAETELRIEIRDFGVFEVKQTKSKPKARNPKSGEIIYVPARRKTHFKPGKLLKKFLSQSLDGNSTTSSEHNQSKK